MSELKYTNDHECLKIEGDMAWVGITKYAQEALGDLVFIELPELGKSLNKGDDLAVIESVKTAAEVYAPIDGEITEVNEALEGDLELLTQGVLGEGWIAKIKLTNQAQISELMDESAYNAFVEGLD